METECITIENAIRQALAGDIQTQALDFVDFLGVRSMVFRR
jgi:hypothetical protein